ncbi:MAG: transposase [Deltaproteobacteria bacterium]|nr:MAG: transposase [Deltaproteobacteria bacterium]
MERERHRGGRTPQLRPRRRAYPLLGIQRRRPARRRHRGRRGRPGRRRRALRLGGCPARSAPRAKSIGPRARRDEGAGRARGTEQPRGTRVQGHRASPRRPDGRTPTRGDPLFLDVVRVRANPGVPRRDLPDRLGPWKSVYNRFAD